MFRKNKQKEIEDLYKIYDVLETEAFLKENIRKNASDEIKRVEAEKKLEEIRTKQQLLSDYIERLVKSDKHSVKDIYSKYYETQKKIYVLSVKKEYLEKLERDPVLMHVHANLLSNLDKEKKETEKELEKAKKEKDKLSKKIKEKGLGH